MAFKKKAGNADEKKAPAGSPGAEGVEFQKREVMLVDDKRDDNGVVVRKIERTVTRELVDGEIVETVVTEKFVHGLFTVNCPRDSDPKGLKRVPVSIDGYHPDKSPFHYSARIQRGVNVPNVPYCALEAIATAIETRYFTEEKNDRSGNEMKSERGPAYPITTIEGPYWTRKPDL